MDNLVGQQLGNYRLIRLLGQGGFARVYLGEHVYLQTQAALKVLRVHLAQEMQDSFLREAKTIAHLEHPHIVRVLEFGVEDDEPFLVMSYAPHGTLRQRHRRGTRVPVDTVLSYVQQIASALDYAHRQRLIHRDVKPENMLLDRNNEALLSDFGLVQLAHSTGSQTEQSRAGTFAYMAPEQLQGKPRPASDQYALGITVYEWLSGSLPFRGNLGEVASQHLLTPPPPLAAHISGISPNLEQVVLKALMKDPQQRFANVQEFANAFEQACKATENHAPTTDDDTTIADPNALKSRPIVQSPDQSQVSTKIMPGDRSSEEPHALTILPDQLPVPERLSPTGRGTTTDLLPTQTPPDQTQLPTIAVPSQTPLPTVAVPSQTLPPAAAPKPVRHLNVSTIIIVLLSLILVGGGATVLALYPRPVSTPSSGHSSNGSSTGNAVSPGTSSVSLASAIPGGWHKKDDPLSGNSQGYGWEEVFTIYRACQFQNGHYNVQESGGGGDFAFCLARATNYSDFAFEVQMKTPQGTGGGIIFRAGSNGEYFFSVVNQDNNIVTLFVKNCSSDGSCRTLRSVTSDQLDGLFRKDPNSLNGLAVVAKGDSFAFFVNEQEVAQLTDNTYRKGQIGLGVGTASPSFLINRTDEMSNATTWTP